MTINSKIVGWEIYRSESADLAGEVVHKTHLRYARIYNHSIPQHALGHITPIQALKNWHKEHPEIFSKQVYNQPGLDT